MLKIEDLNVFYGGIHAIKGISFDVPQGKITTLIGANGAGKHYLKKPSVLWLNKNGKSII